MIMARVTAIALAAALSLVSLPQAHSEDFPEPRNTQSTAEQPFVDARDAVKKLALPPGFRVSLFAAEPDVQNPIACDWDNRGRLWVAENYTYAERPMGFDRSLRDRIIILDGAGSAEQFTSRKVFTDNVQMLTSVAVGNGGIWAMCPPQLLFIPDRNGDDTPDGPPEVAVDGFTVPEKNYHNFANGLKFGPDGWLYGRCGGSCPGEIGVPGTPDEQRLPLRGGIWRYHPTRKVTEVINFGTTNPWGHDWDQHGELFFINTVNGHLWHGIVGAHFHRTHTRDPNPRVYTMLDQHADHWHFDTSYDWTKSRDGSAGDYGGGHAHVGMMIYQGGNWPAEYDQHLFTVNLHGRCVNQDVLERQGSGYVGHHAKNLLKSDDPWFRGMDLTYGPDGSVLLIDWCDVGECHDADGVHRTSGRIYKLSYGDNERPAPVDFAKLDEGGLTALHGHRNEWYARQARLELVRRREAGAELQVAIQSLRHVCDEDANVVVRLRALWSLYAIRGIQDAYLREKLLSTDEHERVWAIRLLTDQWPLDTVLSDRPAQPAPPVSQNFKATMVQMAQSDPSGLVRLTLASTLQRLPVAERAELAAALVAREKDAEDHNLPLLIWYGLIPLGDAEPMVLAELAGKSCMPTVRNFIARRLAEDIESNPEPVNALLRLAINKPEAFQADILAGLSDALAGLHKATKPAAWSEVLPQLAAVEQPALRDRVRDLDALFGDVKAVDDLRAIALDASADAGARKAAFQMLIRIEPVDLRQLCEKLLVDGTLGPVAIRGLARSKDARVGPLLVDHYDALGPAARSVAIDTLASRPTFAKLLLQAVTEGKIPRTDITTFHIRQIRGFKNREIEASIAETWGALRDVSADKQAQIATLKRQLNSAALAGGDRSAGRLVFSKTCANCHRLYGEGGTIGPDLTGAGRDNLQYLLDNVVDPSAVVTADFRMSVVTTDDGRILNGVVAASTPQTVTLQTATDRLTLDRAEIVEMNVSPLSLMPDGLLGPLNDTQVRDLFAYLMSKQQVPVAPEH